MKEDMDEKLLTTLLKELAETKKFIQKLMKKYKILKMKRLFSKYAEFEKERRRKEEEERERKAEEERKRIEKENIDMKAREEEKKKIAFSKTLHEQQGGDK